jgi:hypothetical protein
VFLLSRELCAFTNNIIEDEKVHISMPRCAFTNNRTAFVNARKHKMQTGTFSASSFKTMHRQNTAHIAISWQLAIVLEVFCHISYTAS